MASAPRAPWGWGMLAALGGQRKERRRRQPLPVPRSCLALGFLSCLLLSLWSPCFVYWLSAHAQHGHQLLDSVVLGAGRLVVSREDSVRGLEGLLGRGSSGPGDSGVERAGWVGPPAASCCLILLPHFHTSPLRDSQL